MMQVKVVRIYLSEDARELSQIYDYLHDEKIRGATVFKGIKGFGNAGVSREASFLDLHFDLPVVIEFFDECKKVDRALEHFKNTLQPSHVLSWTATMGID